MTLQWSKLKTVIFDISIKKNWIPRLYPNNAYESYCQGKLTKEHHEDQKN